MGSRSSSCINVSCGAKPRAVLRVARLWTPVALDNNYFQPGLCASATAVLFLPGHRCAVAFRHKEDELAVVAGFQAWAVITVTCGIAKRWKTIWLQTNTPHKLPLPFYYTNPCCWYNPSGCCSPCDLTLFFSRHILPG